MRASYRKTLRLPLAPTFPLGVPVSRGALAQDCRGSPQGRTCRLQQPIRLGVQIDVETQRKLGWIENHGCSHNLVHQFRTLTSSHCARVTKDVAEALAYASLMKAAATYAD